MATPSSCNTTSTSREKTMISHLEPLPTRALRSIASLATHPLFSVAAATYVLALLYLPGHLLSMFLSPVSLTTLLLLLAALLHLCSSSTTRSEKEEKQKCLLPPCPPCESSPSATIKTPPSALISQQNSVLSSERHHYVDWALLRRPLGVIYEEYEGEVEEDDVDEDSLGSSMSPRRTRHLGSPGTYRYTDDSDEDSGEDSPAWASQESFCFQWEWELELEDDGLIEISLDDDNLIEIDISACG